MSTANLVLLSKVVLSYELLALFHRIDDVNALTAIEANWLKDPQVFKIKLVTILFFISWLFWCSWNSSRIVTLRHHIVTLNAR